MRAEPLTDPIVDHGEGPVFSSRWPGPRWVDLLAGDILELGPDGAVARQHVGTVAAVIRPRRGGGHVIAGERGLLLADDDALDAPVRTLPEVWAGAEVRGEGVRMNEGGCDPAGNLYLGSMAYDGRDGGGTLYRFGPDLAPEIAVPEVTISNGLEWSPDETLAYYVDTGTGRIDVFDWDADGGLRNRRPFVEVEGEGGPDGLTVDAEGGVWVALWGGWAVRRYSPQGRLDAVIEVPARQVTAVTFAGPDLDRLIITTSRHGLGEDEAGPAGALFGASPGIRGRPVREFAG